MEEVWDRFPITLLGDRFGCYNLMAICPACNYRKILNPHQLIGRFPIEMPLLSFAQRLRCSKCGKKGCRLETHYQTSSGRDIWPSKAIIDGSTP